MHTHTRCCRYLGGIDASCVTYLDLHGCMLSKVDAALGGLAALRVLVLSYNELARLEGLESLSRLTRLDVDHNAIRKVTPGTELLCIHVCMLACVHAAEASRRGAIGMPAICCVWAPTVCLPVSGSAGLHPPSASSRPAGWCAGAACWLATSQR